MKTNVKILAISINVAADAHKFTLAYRTPMANGKPSGNGFKSVKIANKYAMMKAFTQKMQIKSVDELKGQYLVMETNQQGELLSLNTITGTLSNKVKIA